MHFAGAKIKTDTMLLALTVDRLTALLWTKTKDAEKGRNKPKSIYEALTGINENKETDAKTFSTAEEFYKYRNQIIKELKNG